MNRRQFLQTSLAVGAGLTVPTLWTACTTPKVQQKPRRPRPSGRINVGFIGFGTMAQGTLPNFLGMPQAQVVGIADPVSELPNYGYRADMIGGRLYGQRLSNEYYAAQAGVSSFNGCRAFEDYRDLLDKGDVDAVVVSTPDHWHCPILVEAARRGIHVYGQKPLSLTVEDGQRMVRAVRASGITFQTGSQQRSTAYFRIAAEFVRNGRLGRLERIEVGLPGGHKDWSGLAARTRPEPVPKELNYDLWLGPAPARPYVPALLQMNWRHNFDYSGGMITDWGAHNLDIVQWALGLDFDGGPVAVENVNATLPAADALYNTPTEYAFDVVYADGLRVNVSNGRPNGIRFIGENGKSIFVNRNELTMTPTELRREQIRPDEIRLYESRHHEKNFVECIYSGQPTVAPVEVGHRTISISHLANIAIRLGRTQLKWDPVTETIPGDAAANALLRRESRRGYRV